MGLEENIANKIALQMAQEIDDSLMADMLEAVGWTKIKHGFYYFNNQHAVNIRDWLDEHCQGHYRRLGPYFLFELEKDATMFILRWS